MVFQNSFTILYSQWEFLMFCIPTSTSYIFKRHSKRCLVLSCHFNLHFPGDLRCWVSFHVSFDIYIFLGEMFSQIFLFWGVSLNIEVECLFIFSRYKSYLRYMYCEYFLPFSWVLLCFLKDVIQRSKVFCFFHEMHFIVFFFLGICILCFK